MFRYYHFYLFIAIFEDLSEQLRSSWSVRLPSPEFYSFTLFSIYSRQDTCVPFTGVATCCHLPPRSLAGTRAVGSCFSRFLFWVFFYFVLVFLYYLFDLIRIFIATFFYWVFICFSLVAFFFFIFMYFFLTFDYVLFCY